MVKNDDNEHPTLLDMIKSRFCKEKEEKVPAKPKRTVKTIETLEEKRIAYYAGIENTNANVISQMLLDIGATETALPRKNKLCGLSILADNKTLAFKKAGAIFLEAYDAGAEVLIVENEACYEMMESNFSKIENVLGRKLIGLELILAEDFVTQISKVQA